MSRELEGQTFCILGRNGFIGSTLAQKIEKQGGQITSTPTKEVKAVFNFASPTHLPFEKNPDYYINSTMSSFMYLLPFCRDNDIPLVWPSSALVYEKDTPFARLKKTIEELQFAYADAKVLGLRIFPVYGVGEGERNHPTAIYQWCQQMKKGESPIVYGDGKQTRDFIYVDDVAENILEMTRNNITGIADVGAGKSISFNEIIGNINDVLQTNIKPTYIPRPSGYSEGIVCQYPVPVKVDMREGVSRIIYEGKS